MAESVIKQSEGFVIVASSGTTSESYSAKLNKLLSAYNNMTLQQKARAFIIVGNTGILSPTSIQGTFTSSSCSPIKITIITFDIISKTANYSYVYPSSKVTIEDLSSNVTSNNMQLGYYT